MHESGIVASLVARAETVVHDAGAHAAHRIGVHVGASSGIDPEVVRTHWKRFATASTRDAILDVVVGDDPVAPDALAVKLAFVDVDG